MWQLMSSIVKIAVAISLSFPAALHAECDATYSNPVLVETHEVTMPNPFMHAGMLGIGDPAAMYHEGTYYLYPTGDNHSYDVYTSSDLVHWTKGPKVFQSGERSVWAPDVFFDKDNGLFYLYYTVNGRVGVASADRPDGVFKDRGTLISHAIDAHMFRDDDGSYFLYYARYPKFSIFVQPMESPVKKKGRPVQVIAPSEAWEKNDVPVTEAPWVVKHDGVYYLLYSGGSPDSEDYAIGYATAAQPLGPYTKYRGNPIIHKGNGIFGPGHVSVVQDRAGKRWLVYHQQKNEKDGWDRIICIDPIWFDKEGVLHGKASRATPRPAPGCSTEETPPAQ